jgi:hypothetical protein
MNTYAISPHPEGPEYEVHVIGYGQCNLLSVNAFEVIHFG